MKVKQSERRRSGESIANENQSSSSLNLQVLKGDVGGVKIEQTGGIISQSILGQNDQDSILSQPGNNALNNNQKGYNIGQGGTRVDQLGKTKSKSMIHSGSNLQGNSQNTNSNNHLFLTSQGNNHNTNSTINIANQQGGLYKHIEQFPKIQEAYGQLNTMVEFLEEKVDGVIERHEAEFLLAYKNHMIKIRKELQEMKNRMDEQDKKLKAGDKMDQLEKQLSWFRDESLKLYDKLGQKDKQITDFKHVIADQKKDISFQEGQITQLKKKIRVLVRKVSGTIENFNPDDRSASSSSAQHYFMGQGTQNDQVNNLNGSNPNYVSQSSYAQSNFGRGKGSQSYSVVNQSRRPLSSEYSQNYARYQTNNSNKHIGIQGQNNSNNISNLSNNNIYLSSLNHNTSNNQYNLLGDVAEQNETQNSQINNDDPTPNNAQSFIMRNPQYQQGETTKQDFWIPQSEFIAEMVMKYQNDHISLVRELTHMFKIEDDKRQKTIKQMKDRLDKILKEKLTQNVVRSDLENFFLECIETVRKQIIKRKPPPKNGDSHLNFYLNQIKDYSIFRNEDKIKILELLLSNERLMMYIYQKIFPQNFNKYMSQAVNSTQILNKSSNEDGSSFVGNHKMDSLRQQFAKLNGKQIDAEDLVKMVDDIDVLQFKEVQKDSDETTPVNKLSIQQQFEKVTRPKTREYELSQDVRASISGNRQSNRQRPLTQQNQFTSRNNNHSAEKYDVNLSFQIGNNKRSSNNSFSIDTAQNNIQGTLYQPPSTKQKLNSLINSDFSVLNSQNKPSFKSKIATYKMY